MTLGVETLRDMKEIGEVESKALDDSQEKEVNGKFTKGRTRYTQ